MFVSSTVCIAKDTSKEDFEFNLKSGWERQDPGRNIKSAKSRTKYIVQIKSEKGEELKESEKVALMQARERRTIQDNTIPIIQNQNQSKPIKLNQKDSITMPQISKFNLDLNKAVTTKYISKDLNKYIDYFQFPRLRMENDQCEERKPNDNYYRNYQDP